MITVIIPIYITTLIVSDRNTTTDASDRQRARS